MDFIRFHSVSFGEGPGSKIAAKDFPVIFDLGSCHKKPNEID